MTATIPPNCAELVTGGRLPKLATRDQFWKLEEPRINSGELEFQCLPAESADGHQELAFRTVNCCDHAVTLRYIRLRFRLLDRAATAADRLTVPGYNIDPELQLHDPEFMNELSRVLTPTGYDTDVPGWKPGLFHWQPAGSAEALLLWYFSTEVPGCPALSSSADGVELIWNLLVPCRLAPGETVEFGTLHFHSVRAAPQPDFEPYRRWQQERFRRTGVHSRYDRNRFAITELYIGERAFARSGRRHSLFRTIPELTAALPQIARQGWNVIQLMPAWPFPEYTVHAYEDPQTFGGSAEELCALTRAADRLGIQIWLDVVLHGTHRPEYWRDKRRELYLDQGLSENPPPESAYLRQHPDWYIRREDGTRNRTYTDALDPAEPSFQEHLVTTLEYYANTLGIKGFRFDAATWNFFPNWGCSAERRPYHTFYGSRRLLERLRARLGTEVVFYTETAGVLLHDFCDLSYNYDQLEWMNRLIAPFVKPECRSFIAATGDRPLSAREVQRFFRYRELFRPEYQLRVEHSDSHDTFDGYSNHHGCYKFEAFRPELARLLFGWNCLLGGPVKSFRGADTGNEAFYRDELAARAADPLRRDGRNDFAAAEANNARIFALEKSHGDRRLLALFNFSSAPETATVRWRGESLPVGLEPFGRLLLER